MKYNADTGEMTNNGKDKDLPVGIIRSTINGGRPYFVVQCQAMGVVKSTHCKTLELAIEKLAQFKEELKY